MNENTKKKKIHYVIFQVGSKSQFNGIYIYLNQKLLTFLWLCLDVRIVDSFFFHLSELH